MLLKVLLFILCYIFSNITYCQSSISPVSTIKSNYNLTYQPNYFSPHTFQNIHLKHPKITNTDNLFHHNFNAAIYNDTIEYSSNNRILYQNAKSLSNIQGKPFQLMPREGAWDNPDNAVSIEDKAFNLEFIFAIWEFFNP